MRALKLLGLIVVVALTGLLSGGASGAAHTTAAIATAAAVMLPAGMSAEHRAQPAPAAPAAPAHAVPAAAPAAPAPAAALVAPRAVPGTPCVSTARACIELSSNRAWLISGGAVQYGPVPITHGRAGYRTPPGTFHVTFKNRNHRSSIFNNAPMPYSVFFNGGIAFHQGSLTQLSHGCIHLSRAAAQTFFNSLNRGDVVQVAR
jgi:lipoprotein-anchoring transpeptidase ErfK/SrfK